MTKTTEERLSAFEGGNIDGIKEVLDSLKNLEEGSSGSTIWTTITLSDSDIKSLDDSEYELVASPGENKVIIPMFAILAKFGTSNYLNIYENAILGIKHSNFEGLGSQFYGIYEEFSGVSHLLGSGESIYVTLGPSAGLPTSGTPAPYETGITQEQAIAIAVTKNRPLSLYLSNGSNGNLTGGGEDAYLVVTIQYTILDI